MPPTRERILTYLAEKHKASVFELSRSFEMTPANIRYHLGLLMEEGAVSAHSKGERTGRGRPPHEYRLTAKSQENSLAALAGASFHSFASMHPRSKRDILLRKIANRLANLGEGEISWSPQRLRAAVSRLNELKYRAHWEARAEGPQVKFGQCPYAEIIDEHPLLCQLDAYLLETMLGIEVEQLAKISHEPNGVAECIFKTGSRLSSQA